MIPETIEQLETLESYCVTNKQTNYLKNNPVNTLTSLRSVNK